MTPSGISRKTSKYCAKAAPISRRSNCPSVSATPTGRSEPSCPSRPPSTWRNSLCKQAPLLSSTLRDFIAEGRAAEAVVYLQALKLRSTLQGELERFLAGVRRPHHTPRRRERRRRHWNKRGIPTFCSIWSLCGVPAVTIPVGFGPRGLPLGLQIVGQRGKDSQVLSAARWCEGWFSFPPWREKRMNLHALLMKHHRERGPLRVGLIGAGKFGSMYLAQARDTEGIHIAAIADLVPARVLDALRRTGWKEGQGAVASLPDALAKGTTFMTDDAFGMIASPGLDVIIDATGSPSAGIAHVLACCRHRKHIIMVNVEADALAGPLLARRAEQAGIVYSLAYGDQPALICEMVDWARACGFTVVAAGKGTKYLPVYHQSTPETDLRSLRFYRGAAVERGFQRQDVQLFPRRDEIGDRDGRRGQCDRPRSSRGRASFPALRRGRSPKNPQTPHRRRSFGRDGSGGGRLQHREGRTARIPRSALGGLCDLDHR